MVAGSNPAGIATFSMLCGLRCDKVPTRVYSEFQLLFPVSPLPLAYRRALMSECLVEGCPGQHHAKGYCKPHYLRWHRRGTTDRILAPTGEALNYIDTVVMHWTSDGCFIWPYQRDNHGYSRVRLPNGKDGKAHRLVCEMVNGPPPTPSHHAAHSCGNGHRGCVSPKHLRWATPAENQLDRYKHGTMLKGERQWKSKLTASKVREIRQKAHTVSNSQLAREYNVTPGAIDLVVKRKNWAWVD